MGFNPLAEKGIPLEKQVRSFQELTAYRYDAREIDPYTRCRIIVMNGAEFEGFWFSHQMARHTAELDIKRHLAMTRRIEQQQQKAVASMVPPEENTLEHTLGYEQVAVDLTAWLARQEPDAHVRAALDFGLLEDFDHLYRYANMMDMRKGRKPEEIVGKLTEITPGRPTVAEHRHPFDSIRKPFDGSKASILTQLHAMTIVAAEQQTMNFYANVANRAEEDVLRKLYVEIGLIEEQHVSHYESLLDPTATWAKRLVMHEYNECYLYWSFAQQETNKQVKKLWEHHLEMEVGHLHEAVTLMQKIDGVDAATFLPRELPAPVRFESNIDYVRDVLAKQIDLTADETRFVPLSELPKSHRYFTYNQAVNAGGTPTQMVIEERIRRSGTDYRFETKPHPVERFRDRKVVPTK